MVERARDRLLIRFPSVDQAARTLLYAKKSVSPKGAQTRPSQNCFRRMTLHQRGNGALIDGAQQDEGTGPVECTERLGGLLKHFSRAAQARGLA